MKKLLFIAVLFAAPAWAQNPISVQFVANGTALQTTTSAGFVPATHWNHATGASGNSSGLLDSTGTATSATIAWKSDNPWSEPVCAAPLGNCQMMSGYLDNGQQNTTTMTVTGLASGAYTVYVYANGSTTTSHTASYQIGTVSTNLTYTSNFNGTFTLGANYLVFNLTGVTGFTLSAIPGAAANGFKRAPLNGIQIVPSGTPPPPQTCTGTATVTVVAGTPPLSLVTPITLPGATVGMAYSVNLVTAASVTGGKPPYTFALQSGSTLPAGLSLSTAGVISGTPTTAGTTTFMFIVTDSSGMAMQIEMKVVAAK